MPTSKSNNKRIGITLGDPAGIGPEVVAKALRKPSIRRLAQFTLIGDLNVYRRYCKTDYTNCEFISIEPKGKRDLAIGYPNRYSAKASYLYLQEAVRLLKSGHITSLVTASVSKKGISAFDPSFQGHTEFLANAFGTKNAGMMFVSDQLKTILTTRHLPLKKVPAAINSGLVYDTIALTHEALQKSFKIKNPHIAICGMNPHAGEQGQLGGEEAQKISPAIRKAKKRGWNVSGPYPADTLFYRASQNGIDCVVAMYHDQGLIPVKTVAFTKVVNLTVGLPFIRTSPAHGTAFDIAGKNRANPDSMCEAIKLAARLS